MSEGKEVGGFLAFLMGEPQEEALVPEPTKTRPPKKVDPEDRICFKCGYFQSHDFIGRARYGVCARWDSAMIVGVELKYCTAPDGAGKGCTTWQPKTGQAGNKE